MTHERIRWTLAYVLAIAAAMLGGLLVTTWRLP